MTPEGRVCATWVGSPPDEARIYGAGTCDYRLKEVAAPDGSVAFCFEYKTDKSSWLKSEFTLSGAISLAYAIIDGNLELEPPQ